MLGPDAVLRPQQDHNWLFTCDYGGDGYSWGGKPWVPTTLSPAGRRAASTAGYLYGLAAHSTWVPGDPIEFRLGDRVELTGRVVCVQSLERLSYLLRSGPHDPPVYLTWLLRPTPGGCTVRLASHGDPPG